MFQYILLGLLGLGSSLPSEYVKPRIGFEARHYTNNSMGRFRHIGTTEDMLFKNYIRVKTTYTIFKFFDLNMSMQGWAREKGFVGGQGGGRWGAALRLTDNLELFYEHYSAHSFDNSNLAGSYDYIGLTIQIGYDHRGYNSILGLIKGG